MPDMSQAEMEQFLEGPLVAVFTTVGPDGAIHSAPLWFQYEAGLFYLWVDRASLKVRDIERNPRASLCIATQDEPYRYVSVSGSCELSTEGLEQRARSISQRYYGPERGLAFADAELARTATVLVKLSPDRVRTESAA